MERAGVALLIAALGAWAGPSLAQSPIGLYGTWSSGRYPGVSFTLAAAVAVAGEVSQQEAEIVDCVSELVDKSLVAADVSRAEPRFRLLDTTRAYAVEKLAECGKRELLARRHAEHSRSRFEQAAVELEMRTAREWLAETPARSRICVLRSTGPSRQTAIR